MTDSGEQMQKTAATESGAQRHRDQARATSQTGPLERRTVPVRRIGGAGAAGEPGAEVRYRGQRPQRARARHHREQAPPRSGRGQWPQRAAPNGAASRRYRGRRALQRQVTVVTNQPHGVGWSRANQQSWLVSRAVEAQSWMQKQRPSSSDVGRAGSWPLEAVLSACVVLPAHVQAV